MFSWIFFLSKAAADTAQGFLILSISCVCVFFVFVFSYISMCIFFVSYPSASRHRPPCLWFRMRHYCDMIVLIWEHSAMDDVRVLIWDLEGGKNHTILDPEGSKIKGKSEAGRSWCGSWDLWCALVGTSREVGRRWAQDDRSWVQDGVKSRPRWTMISPRGAVIAPRWGMITPRWAFWAQLWSVWGSSGGIFRRF